MAVLDRYLEAMSKQRLFTEVLGKSDGGCHTYQGPWSEEKN